MPKLPDFIFDSHKRYKADTKQLIAWLAETAQGLGYGEELALFSEEGQSPRTGPIKGRHVNDKARKQAPDDAAGRERAASRVEYRSIFVSEFTKMARFIASRHPAFKVPSLVLKLARSAISVRKRCAEWFKQQRTQKEDASDKTHWHFITVLEDVVRILNPLCDNTKSASEDTSLAAASANSFSLLDTQESKDEEHFQALPPPVAKPARPFVVYTVADDDVEDWVLAVFCLFLDLHEIRTFLCAIWADYRDKKTDLITVSVTTNMAFDVLRNTEQALLALKPELDSYEKIVHVICLRGDLSVMADEGIDMSYVHEFVYFPTYKMLKEFSGVIEPAAFGNYDPRKRRDLISIAQKRTDDGDILADVFPHFILLARLPAQPASDELTKELQKFVFKKEISLRLVFAIRVYLDIHHVLKEQVGRGFAELRSAGVQVKRSLRLRSQNSPKEKFVNWPEQNETLAKNLDNLIQGFILEDCLGSRKRELMSSLSLTEGYYLLSRHPLLCGMVLFRVQLEFQSLGFHLAIAWGTILFVCHLYEACKNAGLLPLDCWEDMEWVMKVHSKERMFRGRVPQNMLESYQSLCLVAGVSTSHFASTSRVDKKQHSKLKLSPKGPSSLKENSPVSTMFGKRIGQGGGVALTEETMQELLAEAGVETFALDRSKSQSKLHRQWARCRKVTPLQFLATLRAALVAEQHMLRFDYVSLHMRCLQLLREIKVKLEDNLGRLYGDRLFDNEAQLAWLVGYILLPSRASNALLRAASPVMDGFIQREGRAECSKVQNALQHPSS